MTLAFLNSLGTGEVFFILLVVLLLFGSKSIPSMARGIGKGMREIQNASNEIKRDIQNSVVDIKREANINRALLEDNEKKDSDKKEDSNSEKNIAVESSETEDEQVGEA